MPDAGEPPRKIKVVDRRRFTDDGEVRPDRAAPEVAPRPAAAEPTVAGSANPAGRPAGSAARPDEAERTRPTTASFGDLISHLANQAVFLMTGGQGIPPQPAQARRVIDYLALLETKTSGNLSAEESQLLSSVVSELRIMFVKSTR